MNQEEAIVLYRLIGGKVRATRLLRQLHQHELAEQVEVDRTSIANIENGRQRPPLHLLWSIAERLGVPPFDLIPTSEEIAKEIGMPILTDSAVAKIEEAAAGDPTVRAKLARFLEETNRMNHSGEP